jgi:hypothetical protein
MNSKSLLMSGMMTVLDSANESAKLARCYWRINTGGRSALLKVRVKV